MKRCISRLGASGAEGTTVLLVISSWKIFELTFDRFREDATRKCELCDLGAVCCVLFVSESRRAGLPPETPQQLRHLDIHHFPGPKKTVIFANHWNPGLGNSPRKCYTPGSTNNPLPGKNGPVLIEDVTFYHLVHGDTPAGCDRLPERTNLDLHGIPNFSIRRFESSRSFLRRFGRRSSRDWLRRKAFAWCRLSKGDSDVTLNPCLCESRKSSTSVTARKTHLPHWWRENYH